MWFFCAGIFEYRQRITSNTPSFYRHGIRTNISSLFKTIFQYQRILKQKNNYLKQLQIGNKTDTTMLEVLNQQFAEYALKVTLRREHFIKELEQLAQPIHAGITNEREQLALKYLPSLKLSHQDQTESEMLEEILTLLNDNLQRERKTVVCVFWTTS